MKQFGDLGLLGMHLEGYGCPGMSAVDYGLACLELEACDSGIRSMVSVQGSLAMFAIWRWGSEDAEAGLAPTHGGRHRDRLLRPDRARPRLGPGCDAHPGPAHGRRLGPRRPQDVDHQRFHRRRRRGLGPDRRRGARLRRPDRHPGLLGAGDQAQDVAARLGDQRARPRRVRLPDSAVLPDVRGLKGPLSCLNEARYGIVWGSFGAARSSLESAVRYAGTAPSSASPSPASSSPSRSSPT